MKNNILTQATALAENQGKTFLIFRSFLSHLFCFFLSVFPFAGIAQDTTQAQTMIQEANAAIEKGDLEQAHNLFTNAAEIFKQRNAWDDYVKCGRDLTHNLIQAGEYDMGLDIGLAFIDLANKRNYEDLPLSLLYKNMGSIHYLQDNYKAALFHLEQALAIREKINPKDPELARDYGNVGIMSRYSNRYNKAIEYIEKAISLQKDDNVLARLYTELGTNYKLLGNFRKSLDNQEQAIRLLEGADDIASLALAYMEKGAVLTELKQERKDLHYLKRSLYLFKSLETPDYNNQINCYKLIAYSYFQFEGTKEAVKGALDSALHNYEHALAIAKDYLPANHIQKPHIMLDMSSVLTRKRDFKNATDFINQSEALLQEHLEAKSVGAADFYGIKADFYLWEGDYEAALNHFQEQINALLLLYNNTDIFELPSEDMIKNSLSAEKLQNALASKARCWYLYYKYKSKDKKHLDQALKTILLFDVLVDHIRTDFANSGSNIAWSDITLDAYESAIKICLALDHATADINYKKQALYFSEKSKALSLLEAFQNTKAKKVAGLSEAALIKERELKLDISELEQQAFQLEQQDHHRFKNEIQDLKKKIFLKKEAYQDFIADLETNSPQYFETKYQLDILDLEQMRALLKEDQAFVEYFVGDSSIYAFKITKTEFEAHILDGEESLMARVADLRNSIYGYFLFSKDRSDQMMSRYAQQYTERAYKMYQKLIEPLGALPLRLIIIPAGPMCDMPFESLLTQKVSDPGIYTKHPYFIKEHSISYAYSATLLKEMMQKQHGATKGTFVGFAPSFGNHPTSTIRGEVFSLTPLIFNKPEIENTIKLLGFGDMFEGDMATEEKFKSIASDYKIIHFATHGMANSNDPDYSLLAFTQIDDSLENEFLYVSDLYNLELNAEMIVLSACETALGKNFRGEGIMSMARGFSYAGAKSIFTTLWSVNDQSTYKIIQRYYNNLQEGMDKDLALRKAKLDYLEKANDFTAHPFLWSPYILVGDTSSLAILSKGFPWLYLLGGLIALGLFVFLIKKLAKKKELI